MQGIIKRLEDIPLSMGTLTKALPNHCGIILYDRLPKTLEALFGRKTCMVVLYQMHKKGRANNQVGHYSLVMKNGKKISYFSSYGFKPEQEINLTHSKGQLLKLLPKGYTYNRVALQRKRHSNTCGLHCIARSYFYRLSHSEYAKLLQSRFTAQNPDDLVSIMNLCLVSDQLVRQSNSMKLQ